MFIGNCRLAGWSCVKNWTNHCKISGNSGLQETFPKIQSKCPGQIRGSNELCTMTRNQTCTKVIKDLCIYLFILISKFNLISFQADLGSPLICKIDSQLHIVGILKPGPKDKFKIGHNYFINVLLYESWIRGASHLHTETSGEFEKNYVGYMNKRMYERNSYQTLYPLDYQNSSSRKGNSSPDHFSEQRTSLESLFFISFCINTLIH